jgi:hypothetical protein
MNRTRTMPAPEPLDPRSEHGRLIAERLEGTLADLLLAVRSRTATQVNARTDCEEAA